MRVARVNSYFYLRRGRSGFELRIGGIVFRRVLGKRFGEGFGV